MENNTQESNETLSRHKQKEIKKQQKEQESKQQETSKSKSESSKKIKNYIITTVVLVILIALIYIYIIKPINDFKPYTSGSIHWHANFEVDLCGVKQDFTKGYDLEHDGIGSLILHTHDDGIIHIEAQVPKKEDLELGNFFDNIKIPFSSTQIMDKKNGDLCSSSKAGRVSMYVNGEKNTEFRNFILKKCESENIQQDCDHILIKFE